MSKKDEAFWSLSEIFSQDYYEIPRYQRNYSWKKDEIDTLIEDIEENRIYSPNSPYYVGTLIVSKHTNEAGKEVFETIDGQQRLTTFTLLFCLLKNLNIDSFDRSKLDNFKLNLSFKSRKESDNYLNYIYSNLYSKEDFSDTYDIDLIEGYELLQTAIDKISDINCFVNYLLFNVKILRIEVPEYTDLNHYFEIMNTRGEQLEAHEYVKSILIEKFKDCQYEQRKFNTIWENCSDIDKYVQLSFPAGLRNKFFGDWWDNFYPKNYTNIDLRTITKDDETEESIDSILQNDDYIIKKNEENRIISFERFSSIITFPNFLLHVLRIQLNNDKEFFGQKESSLDNKELIREFSKTYKEYFNNPEKVKLFGFNLLLCRYLSDKYIIKRDSKTDDWGLNKLYRKSYSYSNYYVKHTYGTTRDNIDSSEFTKSDDITRNIMMILSMFHVSFPTQTRKNWYNGVLNYLYNSWITDGDIEPNKYLNFLEKFARRIFITQYIAKKENIKTISFYKVIYPEKEEDLDYYKDIDNLFWSNLNRGTKVEMFVFNYMDYLLWKKYKNRGNNTIAKTDCDKFRFTQRTSVEHFYSQNPEDNNYLGKDKLDSFGNLSLLSSSENSKMTNRVPGSKSMAYFGTIEGRKTMPTLKYHIMMNICKSNGYCWNANNISNHSENMIEILKNEIKRLNPEM